MVDKAQLDRIVSILRDGDVEMRVLIFKVMCSTMTMDEMIHLFTVHGNSEGTWTASEMDSIVYLTNRYFHSSLPVLSPLENRICAHHKSTGLYMLAWDRGCILFRKGNLCSTDKIYMPSNAKLVEI